jgi:hypothetical protein
MKNLHTLPGEPDADLLREMIGFAAQFLRKAAAAIASSACHAAVSRRLSQVAQTRRIPRRSGDRRTRVYELPLPASGRAVFHQYARTGQRRDPPAFPAIAS